MEMDESCPLNALKKRRAKGPWAQYAKDRRALCLTHIPQGFTERALEAYYSSRVTKGTVESIDWTLESEMVVVRFSNGEAAREAAMNKPPRCGYGTCHVRYLGRYNWHEPLKRAAELLSVQEKRKRVRLTRDLERRLARAEAEGDEAAATAARQELQTTPTWTPEVLQRCPITKDFRSLLKGKAQKRPLSTVRAWRTEHQVEVPPDAPHPVLQLGEVRFGGSLDQMLAERFGAPTPIQAQAWPVLLAGRDCIGLAGTGTGKTLAYCLPAIAHIKGQKVAYRTHGLAPRSPRVLILTPTRELARQVADSVRPFMTAEKVRVGYVYGGDETNPERQAAPLVQGVDLLVAIPGKLLDFLECKVVSLSQVSFLVLDEGDKLLGLGYGDQLPRLLAHIRPDRQCAIFSATWDPATIPAAEKLLRDPVKVVVGHADNSCTARREIEQRMVFVSSTKEKREKLQKILAYLEEKFPDNHRTMLFVNSKNMARDLYSFLMRSGYHERTSSLHGDITQAERERGLRHMKQNPRSIMVATDLGARGIHIDDLACVINVEMPATILTYVHRIGRTGRAGKAGLSYSFISKWDAGVIPDLIRCMKDAGQEPPERLHLFAAMKPDKNEKEEPLATREERAEAARMEPPALEPWQRVQRAAPPNLLDLRRGKGKGKGKGRGKGAPAGGGGHIVRVGQGPSSG